MNRTQWTDRFSNRLGALLPWMSADDAMSFAVSACEDAIDVDPDEAAAVYAASLPPVDVD